MKSKMESGRPVRYHFVTAAHSSTRRPQWKRIHVRLSTVICVFCLVNLLLDWVCRGFYCPASLPVSVFWRDQTIWLWIKVLSNWRKWLPLNTIQWRVASNHTFFLSQMWHRSFFTSQRLLPFQFVPWCLNIIGSAIFYSLSLYLFLVR